MRKIKFRAWDALNREMIYDFGKSKDILTLMLGTDENHCLEIRWEGPMGYPMPLQQFTDLYDKNGKEIYEGDIYAHNGKKFVVLFSDNVGIVSVEINKNLGSVLDDRKITRAHNYREFINIKNIQKYLSIIGNIYETLNEN